MQYDCVASTGNSLPYVNNDDVMKTLEEMNAHVKPGGYIYLDIRNWDNILRQKQRFYIYDPMFRDGNRVNVIQVWDYNSDGSMLFNILYTFERDNHIVQKELFQKHYFPISRSKVIEKLEDMGYTDIEVKFFPGYFEFEDVELIEWHSIIARKNKDDNSNLSFERQSTERRFCCRTGTRGLMSLPCRKDR